MLDSQGKYDEALQMYEDALRIFKKTLGDEHPSVSITYANMAEVGHTSPTPELMCSETF